jgi:HAD superfamily hydrolase (TIGR01662 family)
MPEVTGQKHDVVEALPRHLMATFIVQVSFDSVPGAQNAARLLNDLGYGVIVVTNQAGLAHGYYGEEQMHALPMCLQDRLAPYRAFIDAFYHYPYHPKGFVERFRAMHADRKPSPGMILRALSDISIDRKRSFLIGDKEKRYRCPSTRWHPGISILRRQSYGFCKKMPGRHCDQAKRGGLRSTAVSTPMSRFALLRPAYPANSDFLETGRSYGGALL